MMARACNMGVRWVQVLGLILLVLLGTPAAAIDYGGALSKSLLYFEAQMSGQLPTGHRVAWRGDSGLEDGREQNVSLLLQVLFIVDVRIAKFRLFSAPEMTMLILVLCT